MAWPLDLTPISRMSFCVSNSNIFPVMWLDLNKSAYSCMSHAHSPKREKDAHCFQTNEQIAEVRLKIIWLPRTNENTSTKYLLHPEILKNNMEVY